VTCIQYVELKAEPTLIASLTVVRLPIRYTYIMYTEHNLRHIRVGAENYQLQLSDMFDTWLTDY